MPVLGLTCKHINGPPYWAAPGCNLPVYLMRQMKKHYNTDIMCRHLLSRTLRMYPQINPTVLSVIATLPRVRQPNWVAVNTAAQINPRFVMS